MHIKVVTYGDYFRRYGREKSVHLINNETDIFNNVLHENINGSYYSIDSKNQNNNIIYCLFIMDLCECDVNQLLKSNRVL